MQDDPASILLIAPNWVGDGVFFLPAVDALRRQYPQSRTTLLARPGLCELFRGDPRFQAVTPLGQGRLARFQACWSLRREHFDLAIIFPDSFSAALGAWLSGARQRAGRQGQGRDFFLSPGLRLLPRQRDRHVVEEYLELAYACGAQPAAPSVEPRLQPSQAGLEEQRRLFREQALAQGSGVLVALCPTSAYGPAKCWPAEHWSALAKRLSSERYSPYFLCAPNELESVSKMAAESGRLKVLAPSLAGLAACLSVSDVVVANDSGPLHLAAAVGSRCLGLFGPVNPKWSGPRSQRSATLYRDLDCSPCYARVCPLGHHDCLQGMLPGPVYDAVTALLRRG